MNSLFQVATRRSLPALQMATQIRHVATNAAEIFSILKNKNLGAAPPDTLRMIEKFPKNKVLGPTGKP